MPLGAAAPASFLGRRLAICLGALALAVVCAPVAIAADADADAGAGAATDPPAVIYIWYADGGPAPAASPCAGKKPPGYTCSFGASIDDCQRQVQSYLDRWYADLNVVFTYTRPTVGPFFTVIVTSSGGDWCDPKYDEHVGGIAPISCDHVLGDGACYAFQCGHDARTCATIIAQEQAHLMGLEHTISPADAMCVYVSSTSDGFEDRENALVSSICNRSTQNSYQAMRQRLGVWPGGAKPDPFVDVVQGTARFSTYAGDLQGSGIGCALAAGTPATPALAPMAIAAALACAFRRRGRNARR